MRYNAVRVVKRGESWDQRPAAFSLDDLLVTEAAMAADFSTRLDLSLRKMRDNGAKLEYLRGIQLAADPPEYVKCAEESIPWRVAYMAKSGSGTDAEPFNFRNPSSIEKERVTEIEVRKLAGVNQAFTDARKLEIFHGVLKAIICVLAKEPHDELLAEYKAKMAFTGVGLVKNSGTRFNSVQVVKWGESWGQHSAIFSVDDLLVSEAAIAADYATRLDLSMRKIKDGRENGMKLEYLRGLLTAADLPKDVQCADESQRVHNTPKSWTGRTKSFNFYNSSAAEKERTAEIELRKLSGVDHALTDGRKLEIFHALVRAIISVLDPLSKP